MSDGAARDGEFGMPAVALEGQAPSRRDDPTAALATLRARIPGLTYEPGDKIRTTC